VLQIHLRDLQIHRRLTRRLIFDFDKLLRLGFVGSLQAGALAGLGVHAIIDATPDVSTD
jgi:hypothetical protein